MESKNLSIDFKMSGLSLLLFVLFLCFGCESTHQGTFHGTPEKSYHYQEKTDASEQPVKSKPSPQVLAAIQLTDQAKQLLYSGKIDDAISVLERALNLNPSNGQNYYYLAEAWHAKKNRTQASEFNRLAELYFQDDIEWKEKIRLQRLKILNH